MRKSPKASTSKSAAKPAAPAAHNHADLEAKVAGLEAKLADALKKVEALEKQCAAKPAESAASSGRDDDLRRQLRLYFETVNNRNLVTRVPKL